MVELEESGAVNIDTYIIGSRASGPKIRIQRRKPVVYDIHSLSLLLVSFLSLAIRLWDLSRLPIFIDEATYLAWAQRILTHHDFDSFFYPVVAGKHPLLVWVTTVALLLMSDPLLAGRVVAVVAGLASTVLVCTIAEALYSRNAAIIAAALYTFCPYTLFFDRLAVMEPLLSMLGLLVLYLAVRVAQELNLGNILLLAASLTLAFFTKSTAILFLTYPILALIFVRPKSKRSLRAVALILCILVVLWVSTSRFFAQLDLGGNIARENATVVLTLPQVLDMTVGELLHLWQKNASIVYSWMRQFVGSVAILFPTAVFVALVKKYKSDLFLIVSFLMSTTAIVLASHWFSSRHIVFLIPLMILVASGFINRVTAALTQYAIRRRWIYPVAERKLSLSFSLVLVVLMLFPWMQSDILMIQKPADGDISRDYARGWTSGYGIPQVVDFLRQQADDGGARVLAEGDGLPTDALQVYGYKSPSIKLWPVNWERPLIIGPGAPAFAVLSIPNRNIDRTPAFRASFPTANLVFVQHSPIDSDRLEVYRLPVEQGIERPYYHRNDRFQQLIWQGANYMFYELEGSGPATRGRGAATLAHPNASNGEVWSLSGPGSSAGYTVFPAPWGGDYSVFIRVSFGSSNGFRSSVKLDDDEGQVITAVDSPSFVWIKLGKVHLVQGWHKLKFEITGLDKLDADAVLWTDNHDYSPPDVPTLRSLYDVVKP